MVFLYLSFLFIKNVEIKCCYTQREQLIRNKTVNFKLDDEIADYLNIKESGENKFGEYDLYMQSKIIKQILLFGVCTMKFFY